jgi:hypothetical protein
MQDGVQSGYGHRVEIEIETITAPHEDWGSVFDFGCSRVVGGQVNDVKRTIDGRKSVSCARLTN